MNCATCNSALSRDEDWTGALRWSCPLCGPRITSEAGNEVPLFKGALAISERLLNYAADDLIPEYEKIQDKE